jgi:hypothetical protein
LESSPGSTLSIFSTCISPSPSPLVSILPMGDSARDRVRISASKYDRERTLLLDAPQRSYGLQSVLWPLSDAERSEVGLASGFEDNQQQSREVLASFHQLPVAGARDQMVIHQPGGLHLGINDGGTDELESPLLEIPAYQVRQWGFGGHFLERF